MVLNFYFPMWALLKARAQLSHVLVREAQVEADGGNGEWGGGRLPSRRQSCTPLPPVGLLRDVSLLGAG